MMPLTTLLIASSSVLMLAQTSAAAKLAFLLLPRCHRHRSQLSFSALHSRIASKRYYMHRSYQSWLGAKTGDDDDDDRICDVYRRVQEGDSEWYSNLSKMLRNDEMGTTFDCNDDKTAEVEKKVSVERSRDKEGSNEFTSSNYVVIGYDQISEEVAADLSNSVVIASAELSKSQTRSLTAVDDSDTSSKPREDIVDKRVTERHSEGHYTQFLDNEQEDVEYANNVSTETKLVNSEGVSNKENPQTKVNQISEEKVEPNLVSQSRIVRIYNEFTKQQEYIAPLSTLEKLGYSEKELKLLRPQVLELIVEDRIPKPRRGIPKRWVKSVKDERYDEEEDSFDDDFGWQVQVMHREKPTKGDSLGIKNSEQGVNAPEDTGSIIDETIDDEKDVIPTTSQIRNSLDVSGTYPSNVNDPVQKQRQRQPQRSSDEQDSDSRRQRRRQQRSVSDYEFDERSDTRQSRQTRGSDRRQRKPRRQELLIDRDAYGDDPSGNKFWMDLPMFKDFLMKEARFRLKILGPDWKESVLDESRWRYDLYKTWLQMIDDGVGENPLYTYKEKSLSSQRRPRSQSYANYERDIDTRPDLMRRAPRSQPGVKRRRNDDYEYEERRSRQESDDVEVEQPRRTQKSERQMMESQRPRKESWNNFSDLEESLLSTNRETRGSRQGYLGRSYDSRDDARPRRRSADTYGEKFEEDKLPKRRYSTVDSDDSLQEDGPQRQRRRRSA